MLFQTSTFFVFFIAVLLLIALVRARTAQVLLLVIASYVFYMSWNWQLIGLIIASTLTDYTAAGRIHASDSKAVRRSWLLLSLVVNLGLLGFFKYFNFFVSSVNAATGLGIANLNIILPVGISFYTFQTMSYTIDVYLGHHPPERRFGDFALFVAFFPQLVAGPIVRSQHFLPQIRKPLVLRADNFRQGIPLFINGLVKKVAVADNVGPFVDRIFDNPTGLPSIVIVLATLAFGVQIYCDFSGYTDMARGVGRMLGIQIPINFNYPYVARSFADFWRRWHISLSTWLRDYLYIPLGGNRLGIRRLYVNLMATMALGGLWHGAAWNFVIWGIYQGLLLCIGRLLAGAAKRLTWWEAVGRKRITKFVLWVVVQYFVFFGWLIFRVDELSDLLYCMRSYVLFDGRFTFARFGIGAARPFTAMVVVASFVVVHIVAWRLGGFPRILGRLPLWAIIPFYTVIIFLLILVWPSGVEPFIYFQF
jgi:D-alanyl-lipoteichoic acid acyltransferase DltB (MBOAT superfamily)